MVSKKRFSLISTVSDSDKNDAALKNYYKSWRILNKKSNSPFIALNNSFQDNYLKELEPGPLKLYLYFCFAANNEHGNSWHGIQRIADYFDVQTRTIDNWIKVLVDKELIYRAKKGQRSYTTYLLPFSNTSIIHSALKKRNDDNQDLLDDLIKKIQDLAFIYGEIIKVHHLFQWRSIKGKPVNRDNSDQYLLIITKRNNGVLIGHLYTLRKSDHLSVNSLDIEDPAIFESPFQFNRSNIEGIALSPTPSIRNTSAIDDFLSLINELATIEDWQLEDRQKFVYGNKDDLLPVEEEEPENDVKEE